MKKRLVISPVRLKILTKLEEGIKSTKLHFCKSKNGITIWGHKKDTIRLQWIPGHFVGTLGGVRQPFELRGGFLKSVEI